MQDKGRFILKNIALWMAVTMLFALASCGVPQQPTNGDYSSPESLDTPIEKCMHYNQNGCYYDDEVFPMAITIVYIDFASKQEVPLCSRPECLHNDETCPAFFPELGLSNLFVLEDDLYFFCSPGEEQLTTLVRADLAGNNRQNIAAIPPEYDMLPYDHYTDGVAVYFMANEIKEIDSEIVTYMTLLKIDLETGSLEVIHQFPADEPGHILIGARERKFIFLDMLVNSPEEIYNEFKWLDADTGELGTIWTMDRSDNDTASGIYGDCLYVQDFELQTITETDLFTEESQSFDYSSIFDGDPFTGEVVMGGFALWFDKYLSIFVVDMDMEAGGSKFYNYLLNMENGEILPFTLYQSYRPSQHVPVMADLGDVLLVRPDWLVEEEMMGAYTDITYTPMHAFISKEDYIHSIPNYEYIPSFRISNMPE